MITTIIVLFILLMVAVIRLIIYRVSLKALIRYIKENNIPKPTEQTIKSLTHEEASDLIDDITK